MRTIQKLIILAAAMLVVLPTRAQELSSDKKDVGEIPINYTLSPSGAITYQMPIDVHPDPEKFQPEISLTYNSQQGESALGYGWNIGGLSAITHVSGNIYYDGKVTPLSVMEDKLMLDGTRLIKTGTDSWQAEQGFVKLKKLTSDALEARYPNGNTVMFETSVQTPFSYVQTNCRNRKGRNMKYVYTQAGNLSYLQKIMYGETEGAFNDSIVFSYRNATSGAIRYADGKSVRNSKLLEKVESYYRGELWRRYLLTYEKREVDHLIRIDCQTETRALNPLQFKYGDVRSIEYFNVRTIHLPKYFENSKSGGYDCLALSRGRFDWSSNSDGLISYPQESTYALLKWSNKDAQYGSRYDENQELLIYKNLSETPPTPVSFTAGKGFQRLIAVDVNGSGTDVPVKVNYYAEGVFPFSGRHKEKLVVAVYNRNMSSDIHKDYTYESSECVIDGSLASPRQREFLFGDFNGDGKTELLAISSCRNHVNRNSKTSSYALLVDLDKQTTLFEGSCFDYAFFQQMMEDTSPDRLIPLDYNGDGKTDICLINHDGTFVYEFTGNGFRQLAYVSAANGIGSSRFNFEDSELLVADLNGDGNMDLVLTPRDSHYGTSEAGENDMLRDERTRWRFLLSMGNSAYRGGEDGFAVSSRKYLRQYFETGGQNFMLVDVDSDGLPDLLRNVCGKIDVYLNKAGQLDSMPSDRATAQHANKLAQFAIANVTQSYFWAGGLICVDNGNIHSYDYTHKENRERMLHEMTDSYGLVTKHYYTDIMNASKNRYETKDMEEVPRSSYPYVTIAPHHYVGIWAEKYDGKTQVASADYKYTNAVFHLTGLGFRGFKKIETTDYLNHRKVTSFMDPALCGAEVRRETPTDTIVRNYVLDVNPNKTALLKLQKEAMTNTLDKTAFTAEYTYNNYGQAIRSIMRKGLNNVEDVRTSYINVDNAENYLLGLHDFSSMETALYDSTSVQNDEIIYDSRYLPIRKVTYATPGIVTEELFTYDENQRLLKQKQRAYEAEEYLIKTYSYDAEGRLTRETDAMGLNTDYSYDQETGLLQSITDHKGRTTRNEYDEWGNLITVRYPDEHAKQTSLVWTEENEPGLFVATTAETGKPTVKTYYDRMKREIRSAQIRFDGKVMKTDKAYNIKTGLLERISLPTTDSLPSQWSHYHYDRFDRQTSIRYASGKVDSCAYGALTDTIIENGIMHVREFDEAGMMTRATDAAGSIDYYYRPDGQPLVVVAPGKVETRFYYDGYNRRTAIKDPSAGIRRTDYDPAGSVCKETDADGKEILKTYDLYGRIISQTTPDIHTTYMYDDTENLLLSAVSDNGTALRYTYDAYGRMKIQREEAPDGKWLQKEYAYTTDGLPASISYSSQEGALTTELLTYVNGYLTEVRLADGTLVYRHDEENALGQLTKLSTGGMQRNYEFNGWGLPARRTITRADESIVFDHSYAFNIENNNLESRTDETRGLTETFGYDFLNRLSIYGSQQVTYDDSGNILSKDDAGELVYTNPNRPYAVTGFDPVAGKQAITGLNITYTAAQRPSVLTQGTKRVVLMYNANHDRTRMQVSDENTEVLTRYYLGGNYERDTDSTGTQERLYLGGSYYDAPGVLVKQNGQCQVYYIHRDYLGSILQIVDVHGNVVEENSFDAWGCRRNPATQTVYANGTAPKLMLGRGYTGHEHLAAFGLINMNARLYDPILGRFLSPDPYVQSPDFTQAFNRYSYCMNSPLCYVDENGEFIFTPILGPLGAALDAVCWGAVIGAGVSAATYSVATLTSGQTWNSSNFWKSVGVGAVGGAIGGAFGYMGSTGSLGAFGNSFGYNMLSGISNTLATNVIFGYDTNWTDILAMTAGSAIGASIPTFGGVKGGSLRNGLAEIGYNSARGAATGLASGLVNSAVNRDPNLIWQGQTSNTYY